MAPHLVRASKLVPLVSLVLTTAACDEDPAGPDTPQPAEWSVNGFAALNDAGVAAATVIRDSVGSDTSVHAIQVRVGLWTVDGGLEVLPLVADMDQMHAVDINASGHVLANGITAAGLGQALLWNGTSWASLGEFHPTGLDDHGNVVGYLASNDPYERTPVLRYAGGPTIELSAAIGIGACDHVVHAIPYDISDAGVVGSTAMWAESFEWLGPASADLIFEYASCGVADESIAEAINDDGVIVGWSGELDGAFVRHPGEAPELLELLPNTPASWGRSCATDVASNGRISGVVNTADGARAVRWSADGVVEDLGAGRAVAINASGLTLGETGFFSGAALVWLPDGTQIDLPVADLPQWVASPAARDRQSLPC